ncbi:MAG: hypothetical protein EXR21_03210 [Flavobacteriaceae bacterium]|nr:hypothetical protein [Flavobacteriaceae bacterium]
MPASEKHLHVVSFDIPYPASYGGVMDVYYKLKALHEAGVKIHLHCYEYGRQRATELNSICESVEYYKRTVFKNPFYGSLPYIVSSRNTKELLQNLLADSHPILFEGLHTCYYLTEPLLKDRVKIVRTHNVEHHYYRSLERVEGNYFKKYFFNREAERLKKFQQKLSHATHIAAISKPDTTYFSKRFPQTFYLPPFHSNTVVNSHSGKGDFVLYHGNLGVGENDEAARFLVQEVWMEDIGVKLVIAGNNPSKQLKRLCENRPDVRLEAGLDTAGIMKLISEAHINLLPTFQATGIKLKLVNALYNGRHCLVNTPMVKNTGLEQLCTVATGVAGLRKSIHLLLQKDWDEKMTAERSETLVSAFSSASSVAILLQKVW